MSSVPATAPVSLPSLGSLPSLPAVPEGWEAKAELVDRCIGAGQRLTLWIAAIIAHSRSDFSDPSSWVSACVDRWGWSKGYLHHIHQVGALLNRVSPGTLNLLLRLHWEKIYCISRLPENLVVPFLDRSHPETLSRDEVRAKVNAWLKAAGDPGAAADSLPARVDPRRPVQPDFLAVLFAPGAELADVSAWQHEVQARAKVAVQSAKQAADICVRAIAVADIMVDHLAHEPQALRAVAVNLRRMADAAEKMAATA